VAGIVLLTLTLTASGEPDLERCVQKLEVNPELMSNIANAADLNAGCQIITFLDVTESQDHCMEILQKYFGTEIYENIRQSLLQLQPNYDKKTACENLHDYVVRAQQN